MIAKMLRLDPDFLDEALVAIQLHVYGDFFPERSVRVSRLKGSQPVDNVHP